METADKSGEQPGPSKSAPPPASAPPIPPSGSGSGQSQSGKLDLYATLGLTPEDVEALAQLPEEEISIETLPRLIMQLKAKRAKSGGHPAVAVASASSAAASLPAKEEKEEQVRDERDQEDCDADYADSAPLLQSTSKTPAFGYHEDDESCVTMDDFLGTMPRSFPHKCLLNSAAQWNDHANGSCHKKSRREFLQRNPDFLPHDSSSEAPDSHSGAGDGHPVWKDPSAVVQIAHCREACYRSRQPHLFLPGTKVVTCTFFRGTATMEHLLGLAKPFGTVVDHLMFPKKGMLEFSTHENAVAMVSHFACKPARVKETMLKICLSPTLWSIQAGGKVAQWLRNKASLLGLSKASLRGLSKNNYTTEPSPERGEIDPDSNQEGYVGIVRLEGWNSGDEEAGEGTSDPVPQSTSNPPDGSGDSDTESDQEEYDVSLDSARMDSTTLRSPPTATATLTTSPSLRAEGGSRDGEETAVSPGLGGPSRKEKNKFKKKMGNTSRRGVLLCEYPGPIADPLLQPMGWDNGKMTHGIIYSQNPIPEGSFEVEGEKFNTSGFEVQTLDLGNDLSWEDEGEMEVEEGPEVLAYEARNEERLDSDPTAFNATGRMPQFAFYAQSWKKDNSWFKCARNSPVTLLRECTMIRPGRQDWMELPSQDGLYRLMSSSHIVTCRRPPGDAGATRAWILPKKGEVAPYEGGKVSVTTYHWKHEGNGLDFITCTDEREKVYFYWVNPGRWVRHCVNAGIDYTTVTPEYYTRAEGSEGRGRSATE